MQKKAFLLRLDPALWSGLEQLAKTELRSINAQIEFLLREALSRTGIAQHKRSPDAERRNQSR